MANVKIAIKCSLDVGFRGEFETSSDPCSDPSLSMFLLISLINIWPTRSEKITKDDDDDDGG